VVRAKSVRAKSSCVDFDFELDVLVWWGLRGRGQGTGGRAVGQRHGGQGRASVLFSLRLLYVFASGSRMSREEGTAVRATRDRAGSR
jgi:hypothetical protein